MNQPATSPATHNNHARSQELARRAGAAIAGGVVSLNRKTDPAIAFARARGCRMWDVDGNEYIDYHAAFAPHILGHNDPEVNAAVKAAMDAGWSLMGSGTTEWEVRFAELFRACVPTVEALQIMNTGSEGTALAIRLARAYTGREHVILTLGGFNGSHNDVARAVMPSLDEIGPRVSPGEYQVPSMSAGVPSEARERLHIVNYNDAESIAWVMQRYPVACVLTEPVLQNIGVVPPREGYLKAVRELCDRNGSLLVFDEVKTGFRSALGGYQSLCGVRPDLSVFGKAVANGYPLGVVGGRAEVMGLVDAKHAARRVLVAGTYNAHPFNVAAGIATLERLSRKDGAVYQQLETRTGKLVAGLGELFAERGVRATISRLGSAFCVYFGDHVPRDWHDLAVSHDFAFDVRYRRALIDHGVYHFPLACKQGSVSAAHGEEDIASTLELTRAALKSV
jgi:glutamate-1-semialdehyde 2,1-aminomutase